MSEFTPDVIARFGFIEEQHPAAFVLMKGALKGSPVSVMVWLDTENEALRPMAIILQDDQMSDLTLEDAQIVNEGE